MSMIAGEISFEGKLMPLEQFQECCDTLCHNKNSSIGLMCSHQYRAASDHHIESIEMDGKKVSVIVDGELFNQNQLKLMCKAEGFEVQSNRTEELILKLYLGFHEECVTKMNGVFAFVVVDERNDSVFLARDPMGVKPLFYADIGHSFVFASEIKGILKHPDITARAGVNELMEMICLGPGRTPGRTYFQGIEEVKPGHCLTLTRNGIQVVRYYTLKDEPWTLNESQTIDYIHDLVSDAILRQCSSEDKIGAMLSGGLDSSIVTAVASKEIKKMNTYSVDYQGQREYFKPTFFQPNRDQDYINLMVKRYDLNSHEVILDSRELVKGLKEAMIARDMPSMADVDSSLLCFCRKMVDAGEKTVLSGECSDEIFGGYPWYTQEHLRTIEHFPWANNLEERFSYLKEEFRTEDADLFVKGRIRSSLNALHLRKDNSEEEKKMKQLMKLNLDWFMQTLIDRADRMARTAGLSVRVPLCDLRIVDALYRIPWSMKYKFDTEKYLLRKAFENELPDEICRRKKSPYPKTHNPDYADQVRSELKKIVDDPKSPILEIIRKEKLEELMNSDNPVPWYGQLMTGPQTMAYFVQINAWLEEYHVEIIHPKG